MAPQRGSTQQTKINPYSEVLAELEKKLLAGKKRQLVFLLVGRTGVGKSSTVNTLIGETIAEVGDWEPTTMEVKSYRCTIHGVKFQVVDTPGLCDDLAEKGNDSLYLNTIKSKVKEIDCLCL